jgi:hypothetical protein
MAYFQTKNPNLVNFGGPWNEKKLIYSIRPFGIHIFGHLVM